MENYPEEPQVQRQIATDAERLPCPSCKAQNVFLTHTVRNLDARRHVECNICGMHGPVKTSDQEALAAWNNLPRNLRSYQGQNPAKFYYFRSSGKYYSESEGDTPPTNETWTREQLLAANGGRMPGLLTTASNMRIVVIPEPTAQYGWPQTFPADAP